MRIMTGVGVLVQRTGDSQGQVGYSVAGRSRGWVTLCVVCTVHMRRGARVFWLNLKTKVGGFPGLGLKPGSCGLVIWPTKSL
jgi:hypothetical protein